MIDKKMTIKRLILFLVMAFLPLIIAVPIINHVIGGKLYAMQEYSGIMGLVGVFGMLTPSIAHILTRIITKEGFENAYLGIHLKGNIKYYAASILVKIAEAITAGFLFWKILMPHLKLSDFYAPSEYSVNVALLLFQIGFVLVMLIPYFGEEWGWRGYMMPKLMKLMGKPAAILVGGILWGLWHAPLTISGHNFGTEYKGFPWLGIVLMCLYCIATNAVLTLLTEKTKSIYPACICHGMNNNICGEMWFMIFAGSAVVERMPELDTIRSFLIMLSVVTVTGIVSFFLFMKKEK